MINKAEILEKFERAKEKWRSDRSGFGYNRKLRFHAPRPVHYVNPHGAIRTYLAVHRDYYLNLQAETFYSLPSYRKEVLVTHDPEWARQASIKRLAEYCKREEESLRKHIVEVERQQAELETMRS